jgi:hypothetical protein
MKHVMYHSPGERVEALTNQIGQVSLHLGTTEIKLGPNAAAELLEELTRAVGESRTIIAGGVTA